MQLETALLLDTQTIALGQTSAGEQLDHFFLADVVATIVAANPANKTFVPGNVAGNIVTIAGHGYKTGVKVTLTTTVALPAPLAVLTDYYLIVLTPNTIEFATSQATALAGTPITLTDAGTGVQTVVVTTTIAGTIILQKTDDPPQTVTPGWIDIGTGVAGYIVTGSSSQAFAGATKLSWKIENFGFRQLRAVVAVTSGTVVASVRLSAKGN